MIDSHGGTIIVVADSPRNPWSDMLKLRARRIPPPTVQTYLPLNGRVIHYHHCPECYEVYECNMVCTIENDLDDPVCHPGKQFGAHCECFDCSKNNAPLDKEFWDKYHGFTK